jgi:GNAT superfamily N-acetyltransferase
MSDPEPRVRNARIDDAPLVAPLMTALGYETSADQMTARLNTLLADPNYVALVVEMGGTVTGMAGGVVERCFEMDGLTGRLLVISVADAVRGQGVGRFLVRAVEDWARARGASEIVVHSGLHRVDAHRFYEREGYGRVGLRFVKRLT